MAYSTGRIFTVDDNGDIDEAMLIDDGICCMEWSPDEEMILTVTPNQRVYLTQPVFCLTSGHHDKGRDVE